MSSLYEYDATRIAGSGEIVEGIAGEAIGNRAICCVINGLYYQADADLAARMPAFALSMFPMAAGQRGEFLVKGFIGLSTWTWTPGGALYVSGTAGQMSHVMGTIRQHIGVAFTATQIFINSQGLDSETGCALLEGATAYVGFDNCKAAAYTNYWVCDGVADDVQIQAAITYAANGGKIRLEEGTFDDLSRIIISNSGISLIGEGIGVTTLNAKDSLDSHLIDVQDDNFTIMDLTLDGNSANQASGDLLFAEKNVGADYIKVERVHFYDPKDRSIYQWENYGIFEDNIIESGDLEGAIYINDGDDNQVVGNLVTGGQGITVGAGGGLFALRNVVARNRVDDVLTGRAGVLFTSGASYCKAFGNTIVRGSTTTDQTMFGLRAETIIGSAYHNSFVNNTVINCGTAISIDEGQEYGIIADNQVFDCYVGPRSVLGQHITIDNNMVYADLYGIMVNDPTDVTVTNNKIYNAGIPIRIFDGTDIFIGPANYFTSITITGVQVNLIITGNYGFNPFGVVANPFDTPNTLIEITGAAAVPTANTDYTVSEMDILISSTDSGNTDNAILIKDPGGVQITPAALSTLDAYYIPIGFQINWGNFTGAAPTVVVAFN